MSSPSPEARNRVISHMNKDHQADLTLYLRHLAHLSPSAAASPELTDITLTTLTIRSASGTHTLPISPPMPSWDARRQRLADLTHAARAALHGVPYRRPAGLDVVVAGGVAFYFFCFALVRTGFVEPGTHFWVALEQAGFPFGAWGFRWLVNGIFLPVLAIHVGEVWWFDRTRLRPGGVERGSWDWWLWMGSGFFEGVRVFMRFDELVREKGGEGQRQGKKRQ